METIYSQVTQADRIIFLKNINSTYYKEETKCCFITIVFCSILGFVIGFSTNQAYHRNMNIYHRKTKGNYY